MAKQIPKIDDESLEKVIRKTLYGRFVQKKNNTYYFDKDPKKTVVTKIVGLVNESGLQAVRPRVEVIVSKVAEECINNQKTQTDTKNSIFQSVIDILEKDLELIIEECPDTGIVKFRQRGKNYSIPKNTLIRKVREYTSSVGEDVPPEDLIHESIELWKDHSWEIFMNQLFDKIQYRKENDNNELWEDFAKLIHGEKYIPLYSKVWKVFFHNLKKSIYELPQKEVFVPVLFGTESTGKSNILNRIFVESGILHFTNYSKVQKITSLFDERSLFRLSKNIIIADEFAGMSKEHIADLKGMLDGNFRDYRLLGLNQEERTPRRALFIAASNKRMSVNLDSDEPVGFRKFVEMEIPKRIGNELMEWGSEVGKVDYFKLLSSLNETEENDFNKDAKLYTEYLKYTTACGLKRTPTVDWFEQYIKKNEGKVVEITDIYREYYSDSSIREDRKQGKGKLKEKIEGFLFKVIKAGWVKVPMYSDCYFFHYNPDEDNQVIKHTIKNQKGIFEDEI